MQEMVREALDYGVIGFFTGLDYAPCISCDLEELVDLASVAGEYGVPFVPHIRGYSANVLSAAAKVLEVGRRTGVKVNITHIGVFGRAQWGWTPRLLALIEKAKADGLRVMCDLIPYPTSGSSWGPRAILPDHVYNFRTPWGQAARELQALMARPAEREHLKAEVEERRQRPKHGFSQEFRWMSDWRDVKLMEVAPGSRHAARIGLSLAELADEMSIEPAECFCQLVETEGEHLSLLHTTANEDETNLLVKHPDVAFSTDTTGISADLLDAPFNAWQTRPSPVWGDAQSPRAVCEGLESVVAGGGRSQDDVIACRLLPA